MSTLIKIYPEKWAALNVKNAGKPYSPCNGTEGDHFTSQWCGSCARDKSMSTGAPLEDCDDDERCDIIAMSMCYDVSDERYPKAWQFGKDGQPCCTEFVMLGDPIPPPPDTASGDLFSPPAAE